MHNIKHVLDQRCADVEYSGPTLNHYIAQTLGICQTGMDNFIEPSCAMSGDPVDASGQYSNIFERCIIIQNHIYMISEIVMYF